HQQTCMPTRLCASLMIVSWVSIFLMEAICLTGKPTFSSDANPQEVPSPSRIRISHFLSFFPFQPVSRRSAPPPSFVFQRAQLTCRRRYQTATKKISKVSAYFETLPYRLDPSTGLIDYNELARLADLYQIGRAHV